ncbi:MAG: type II toxin-antitoxin system HicA family toxin [Thermotogota bacterium]
MTDARTPRITAAEMRRALEHAGFVAVRQSGSHMILKNAAGKRVTLPTHARKTLHPKVVRAILNDADITPDALNALLR